MRMDFKASELRRIVAKKIQGGRFDDATLGNPAEQYSRWITQPNRYTAEDSCSQ